MKIKAELSTNKCYVLFLYMNSLLREILLPRVLAEEKVGQHRFNALTCFKFRIKTH